jgi:hypothetical protein
VLSLQITLQYISVPALQYSSALEATERFHLPQRGTILNP